MSKKEYILAVLHKVSGIRGPADNIKQLLQEDKLTDTYIDYLYEECVDAVEAAISVQEGAKQQVILDQLKFIKDAEIKQSLADQQDIQNLEHLINTI